MSNETSVEERCIRELGWSITQVATSTMADMQRELQHTTTSAPPIASVPPPGKETTESKQMYACLHKRIGKMALVLKTGTLYPADDLFLREAIQKEKKIQTEYRTQIRTECLGRLNSKQQMLAVFIGMADDSMRECNDHAVISRLQAEIKVHQQYLQSLEV